LGIILEQQGGLIAVATECSENSIRVNALGSRRRARMNEREPARPFSAPWVFPEHLKMIGGTGCGSWWLPDHLTQSKGDTMTSKTFLTTTALSLLLATSAFAQSDSTATETENAPVIEGAGDGTTMAPDATEDTMATDGMATDTMDMEAPQSISEMTVGEFLGLDVVSSETGEDVGEIDYVIRGASEPEAVIGIGGFLGLGEYTVALPLSDFSYDAEDRTLMVNRTQEELEAMPEFDESGVEGLEDDVELSTLMQDDTGMSTTSGTTPGMTDGATSTDGMTEDSTMEENAADSDTLSTDGTETEETGSEESDGAEEDATSNN
jgi:hypothetical protein